MGFYETARLDNLEESLEHFVNLLIFQSLIHLTNKDKALEPFNIQFKKIIRYHNGWSNFLRLFLILLS